MVQSIGADHVIDYTREDFIHSGLRYDLMFDCVGNHSLSACGSVMSPRGIHVAVGARSLAAWLKAPLLSPFVSQKVVLFLASLNKQGLVVLKRANRSQKGNAGYRQVLPVK